MQPGLLDIVKACRGKNPHFSTNITMHANEADIGFICVNIPTKNCGIGMVCSCDIKDASIFPLGHTICFRVELLYFIESCCGKEHCSSALGCTNFGALKSAVTFWRTFMFVHSC